MNLTAPPPVTETKDSTDTTDSVEKDEDKEVPTGEPVTGGADSGTDEPITEGSGTITDKSDEDDEAVGDDTSGTKP